MEPDFLPFVCFIYFILAGMQNPGSVPPARLSPLPPEPVDYDRGATVDIPLDNAKVYIFYYIKQE